MELEWWGDVGKDLFMQEICWVFHFVLIRIEKILFFLEVWMRVKGFGMIKFKKGHFGIKCILA